MRLKYKDGHKTHYPSRRTTFSSASFKTDDNSSIRIMCLVPVFILETHNQTNYKMFGQVRPDGECDCSIKTAIDALFVQADASSTIKTAKNVDVHKWGKH